MKKRRSAAALARTAFTRAGNPGRGTGYIGFVGHANLGDEAMFEAAKGLVDVRLESLASRGVEHALAWTPFGGASRFPLVYLGGGTLVNGNYIEMVEECLDKGIRMATLGTGVGSSGFSGIEADIDLRWIKALSRFDGVGVRGPLSLAQLQRAGVKNSEVIGDLALALTPDLPICDPASRTMLFNTCSGRSSEDRERLAVFNHGIASEICRLTNHGWKVIPVAFHSDDLVPVQRVLDAAGLSELGIEKPATFRAYSALARRASMSVSVRLHGSVLASMCGMPNLLLGYRKKCADFCASIRAEKNLIDYFDFSEKDLQRKLEGLVVDASEQGHKLHASCLEYRDKLTCYVDGISRGLQISPKREGSSPS